jgi:tRNA G18 (ribose-2'-O)-methylase SpoU
MRQIVLVAHDIRSCYNVGSLLRTAEGLGVHEVILTGYTPYPRQDNDPRLPHIALKLDRQIAKTALGAELTQRWSQSDDIEDSLRSLRDQKFIIIGLEQAAQSVALPTFQPPDKVALLLGNEVTGLDSALLAACDRVIEIPMFGYKESFNVIQATAMALYHCRFSPFEKA